MNTSLSFICLAMSSKSLPRSPPPMPRLEDRFELVMFEDELKEEEEVEEKDCFFTEDETLDDCCTDEDDSLTDEDDSLTDEDA